MGDVLPLDAPTRGPAPAPVLAVADSFVDLMRAFHHAKARLAADAEHDVEWSAQVVLRHLAHSGPMRASDIAGSLQSDPSTVSRQVAALVRDGLLERRADPQDGRASILVPTGRAAEVLAQHEARRRGYFEAMLADWDAADLERFAALLRRFTTDFDKSCITDVSERTGQRHRPAEGKN